MAITLAVVLCAALTHACSGIYIRRTLAGEGGGTETDQGFYSLMVASPEAPCNAGRRKAKAALVPTVRRGQGH